ncbi:hypothetical protein Cgig2_027655 [Carnegiea gigantea]|uniref:Mitochondrial glycoprotein n=1 Tax=Carnegiea gigantea TaxID=171969 RepID=A0A9Q1JHQ3_9CARY|nr:hypothetical protein Cgig2_027655 [Carnegiea gigantea]
MALTAILRRSASRAAPLAARLIGAQRRNHYATFSAVPRAAASSQLRPPAAYLSSRHFCAGPSSSDKKLLEILQSEVDCVVQSDDYGKDLDTPSHFPFTLHDNVGETTVTLTREYEGETIRIEVSMPNLVTGEEDEDDDAENDEEGAGNESSVPLLVTVTKKNGPSLEFDVTAVPDEIRINSLSLKNPETDDQLAYEGPDFLDLDENLQKAFHKYLEIRGVKPSNTNFLHEYMIEKDSREYLRWLKNVKKFVEA